MQKPEAYYSKKDKHGRMKVHPIFQSQGEGRRIPRAQIYRLSSIAPHPMSDEERYKLWKSGKVEERLASSLPNVVTITKPSGRRIQLKMIAVPVKDLVPTKPSGYLEDRVRHFQNMIKEGKTIPAIQVHKKDGKYLIYDGHARTEAFKREGYKTVPAVENEDLPREFRISPRQSKYGERRKTLYEALEEEDARNARQRRLAAEKQMTRLNLQDLVFESHSSDEITRALAKTEIERRFPAEYKHLFEEGAFVEPKAATPSAIVEAPTATGMSYVQRPSGVTKFARFVEERRQKAEERKKARKEAELSETERRTGIRKTRAEIEKLEAETRKEMAEHPQLKRKQARKIAAQHMIPEEISLRKATRQVPKPKPLPALSGDKRDTSL